MANQQMSYSSQDLGVDEYYGQQHPNHNVPLSNAMHPITQYHQHQHLHPVVHHGYHSQSAAHPRYPEPPYVGYGPPSPGTITNYTLQQELPYALQPYSSWSDVAISTARASVREPTHASFHGSPAGPVEQAVPESSGVKQGLQHLVDAPPGELPGYSIKTLIEYAIRGSLNGRMSLNDIYEAIEERYPIYKNAMPSWRNSARHDISMDNRFVKTPRLPGEPGKGHMWIFDPTRPPKPVKPRRKKRAGQQNLQEPESLTAGSSQTMEGEDSSPGPDRVKRNRDKTPRNDSRPYKSRPERFTFVNDTYSGR